ncbi:hypothetical protein CF067_00815 [Clostridium sporogenes]
MNNKIFKIIKIIDEYNVVVNAGSIDGIKENDILEIFIKGEPIKDPDTKEELGTLDTIKAKLIVNQNFPKFCICGNKKAVSLPTALLGVSACLASKEPQKLNVDSTEISGGLEKDDLKIKIGDLVRKSLS